MKPDEFRRRYTKNKINELVLDERREREERLDEYYRLLGEEIERSPIYPPRTRRGS